MKYLISLDIGTSSLRAILFNEKMESIKIVQEEITSFYPFPGWVEQDPEELWQKTKNVLESVSKLVLDRKEKIEGINITNQRETVVAWSKKTGQSFYKAIVWQDRRTAESCKKMQSQGVGGVIYEKTGLRLDSYFSASKIKWILDNIKQAKKSIKNNDLLVGTVDSWLIWNLTNKQSHVTDVSNASRTMLFNIKNLEWDNDLLKFFKVPKNILPLVLPSASSKQNFGVVDLFGQLVPILAVCGDQTSALYGEQCFKEGDTKATYGTGGFVVVNIGSKIKLKNPKLITTVGWQINKEIIYALEGSIFQSGGSLKWLRDNLGLFKDYEEMNSLSVEAKDSNGIFLIPAFIGLGAPHWSSQVKGLISGLTHQTKKGHLVNAAIEAAAFQVNDILEIIRKDYKVKITNLKVDGGLTNNQHLLQFQADISGLVVNKFKNEELTGLGVSLMAARILNWPLPKFTYDESFKSQITLKQKKDRKRLWDSNLALVC